MVSEKWIIEYSFEQDCFHIDPLDKVIANNLHAISCGVIPSYIPIGCADDINQACTMAERYREQLECSSVLCNY